MDTLEAGRQFGLFGAFVGLLAGAAYSVGGFLMDAATGLNLGTALAFMALLGMPPLFGVAGAALGMLFAPIHRRIPARFGGGRT